MRENLLLTRPLGRGESRWATSTRDEIAREKGKGAEPKRTRGREAERKLRMSPISDESEKTKVWGAWSSHRWEKASCKNRYLSSKPLDQPVPGHTHYRGSPSIFFSPSRLFPRFPPVMRWEGKWVGTEGRSLTLLSRRLFLETTGSIAKLWAGSSDHVTGTMRRGIRAFERFRQK